MVGYAQARRDFEYLETIAELDDQVTLAADLIEFMETPTKKFAAELYCGGIDLWFGEHRLHPKPLTRRARGIAKRHFIDLD